MTADITRSSNGYVHLSWVTEVWQIDWNNWRAEARWPQEGEPQAVLQVDGGTAQVALDRLSALVNMTIVGTIGRA